MTQPVNSLLYTVASESVELELESEDQVAELIAALHNPEIEADAPDNS